MKKTLIIPALVALIVTGLTIGIYDTFKSKTYEKIDLQNELDSPVNKVLYTMDENGNTVPLDFTTTSKKVMPAVVQIDVEISGRIAGEGRQLRDPFQEFFNDDFFQDLIPRGERRQQDNRREPVRRGKGSGVVINANGYIVTNNHVVENASKVEVTMNDQKTYDAEIIGTDPSTDLALIKIDKKNLPSVKMVNSDDVQVGEWVLAIGNPLGFNSTVTAGIVSAVGRNINIFDKNKNPYAVESFIQTDAAINKGNSGGALVNLNGDLVGINAAIASPTGYYSGYGFAIPSNLVNKVVDDLLNYGEVRRAILGVSILPVKAAGEMGRDVDAEEGIYIDSIVANSSADEAGLKPGDVIVSLDGEKIIEMPILQEKIASKRPGEKIDITINRDGELIDLDVTLKGLEKTRPELVASHSGVEKKLGAKFESLTDDEKDKLDLDYGVKISELRQGVLYQNTNLEEGFIILKVNDTPVKSVEQLEQILKERENSGVLIEGIYPSDPDKKIYEAFGMK